jgi:hypothetical protein
MAFDAADLDLIDRTREVRLETSMAGGQVHRTIIWVVVDGGEVFIRSAYGPEARWYREATANSSVILWVGSRSLEARAIHEADPDAIARASAGYLRKYAGDPAAPRMNTPDLLPLTLRLAPA